eukprot:TRINITY_DN4320_c0_g1_i3.p1 TRINITY_DN4320_c0_g1~~TRINITY_DN4320_c0_g1_i3.p1  ORF type:complete len:169 (+),score=37.88 TRINITY_DN4320_c0_g1_i3:95-601(+)
MKGISLDFFQEKLSKQHSEIRHQNTFAASKCGVSLNEAHALDEAAKKVMQDREHVLLTLEKDNHQLNECIMEYEATMALLVQKHKEQMQNAHSELQRERQSMMKLVESEQVRNKTFILTTVNAYHISIFAAMKLLSFDVSPSPLFNRRKDALNDSLSKRLSRIRVQRS